MKIYGLTPENIKQLKKVAYKKTGKSSVSSLAKQLLLEELSIKPSKTTINDESPGPTKRLVLRITEPIFNQLSENAEQNDMTINRYAALILHGHTANSPALTTKEVQSLRDSNYELHKIGVNLNQIAKALNTGTATSLTLKELHVLHELIDEHFSKVGQLLQAARRRY